VLEMCCNRMATLGRRCGRGLVGGIVDTRIGRLDLFFTRDRVEFFLSVSTQKSTSA